ncbi:hypothetical protein D3C80_1513390 [compost metagenome]
MLKFTGFSSAKTKYSACCSSAVSSIIGIWIVCVSGLPAVKFKVCVTKVKSFASAVLKGVPFTTKSTEPVVGLTRFKTKFKVPAFSSTVTKLEAIEIFASKAAVVNSADFTVVMALSFKSSTTFGRSAT